ncbi:MAG TPA: DUF6763 family protein [Steroidobacteraceae bacterium]|nr:DUF6763 family protein [Steroidobacteraceae bacterium]
MARTPNPDVGQWYRHIDKGELFQVVDIDPDGSRIETQSFDGDIEEFSREEWNQLALETCEQPEDWTGPFDDIERDDLGYQDDTEMTPTDWREPVEGTPAAEAWEDTGADDEKEK